MLEREKKKKEQEADQKLREKLKRQIYIFNKEKQSFTRKKQHDINKQSRSLELLENEKMTELENYLSMRSRTTELLYKKQEGVVRELVKTTDVTRDLLDKEKEHTATLETKIDKLKNDTWTVKKQTTDINNENSKFRFPDPFKMNSRVEHASGMLHRQLAKNKELEKNIDDSAKLRGVFIKEESRLQREVDQVVHTIQGILVQTSEVYEKRDHVEAQKITTKDRLNKVKDRFERELLAISLQLSEDKKMEMFMKTKHQDKTHYLRQMREKELRKVEEMRRTKDEYTKAFDTIKAATGKDDMNVIVHDFIEAEEDNFAIFHTIGELLDSNEALRSEISSLRGNNVVLEDGRIITEKDFHDRIASAEHLANRYKIKSDKCQARIEENSNTITSLGMILDEVLKMLQIPKSSFPEQCFDQEGNITERGVLDVMTAVEKHTSQLLKDWYMVELATRSIKTTSNKDEVTSCEHMICRVPSARIEPMKHKDPCKINLLKDKEEIPGISSEEAMRRPQVRQVVMEGELARDSGSQLDNLQELQSYTATEDRSLEIQSDITDLQV